MKIQLYCNTKRFPRGKTTSRFEQPQIYGFPELFDDAYLEVIPSFGASTETKPSQDDPEPASGEGAGGKCE